MAPKFGGNSDAEENFSAGGAAQRRRPVQQSAMDAAYNQRLTELNAYKDDPNFRNYKAQLLVVKKAARNDVEKFNELAAIIFKHMELKKQINSEFAEDASVKKQLLYDLSLAWKQFAKSPGKGEEIYEDISASVQRHVEKKTLASAGAVESTTLNEGERQALAQQQGLESGEKTTAQQQGLFLDVYRIQGTKNYRLEICQKTEDGRNVMGSINVTQAGLDQLLQLSTVPPEEMTINKVGNDRYEIAYQGRSVVLDKTTMATLLAAGGSTLNEFDETGRREGEQAQVQRFQQCTTQACQQANEAPERQEGLQTEKPKKKNFFEQILEWLSVLLNALMMWTGLGRLFQQTGITKSNDDSAQMESDARGMWYTMNTLNQTYNSFQNSLDRIGGGKGKGGLF